MNPKTNYKILQVMITVLAVVAAIAILPQLNGSIFASSGDPAIVQDVSTVLEDTANTDNAQRIWYGGKSWRVWEYNRPDAQNRPGNVTLLEESGQEDVMQFTTKGYFIDHASDSNKSVNCYSISKLRAYIDEAAAKISDAERAAIIPRTLETGTYQGADTDCVIGEPVENALLWPLSTKEANELTEALRDAGTEDGWWLRSPGDITQGDYNRVAFVIGRVVSDAGDFFDDDNGVRSAFMLDLQKILFVSASEEGKSSGSDGLQKVGTNKNDDWKVTLKDDSRAGFTASMDTHSGDAFTIDYSGAATGDNEYISAVIINKEGGITYYGRIAQAAEASGQAEINTAGKMNPGDTLYLFNEQYNGDKQTDYASDLQKIFTKDGLVPDGATNNIIWLNPNGDTVTITVPDDSGEVVLGYTADADKEMHFWTDSVAAKATLTHMDGSYYDSGFNGFDLRDVAFAGESYYLHCSVVNGYGPDFQYKVNFALNDWSDEEMLVKRTVNGFKVTPKKKKAALSWEQNGAVAGYVIQYSQNKKLKKAKTRRVMKSAKNPMVNKVTITKLKSKKVYFFRIAPLTRSIDSDTGKTVFVQGKWSKIVKSKKIR